VAKSRGKTGAAELRAFRRQVSILKKKGLVSKRTDARKQKPTRYMTAKVKALAEVIEGKHVPVKLDHKTALRYKDAGFFVYGDRVVVSKGQAETVRRDKSSGLILISPLGGRLPYEKVVMPYSIKNIEGFLAAASKSPPDPQLFAAKKNKADHWAFTYHGNNSLSTFADLGLLGEYLVRYINLLDDPRNFQYFILYRVVPKFWAAKVYRERDTRKRQTRAKWAKDRREERRQQNARGLALRGREQMQARKETYEEMNARHQREYRERMKQKRKADAAFDDLIKRGERERKAASRAARKNRGK